MSRRVIVVFAASIAWSLCAELPSAIAQDALLDSTWNTKYTTEQGSQIDARVQITTQNQPFVGGQQPQAGGNYQSSFNGNSVGRGTLSQVRIETEQRNNTPLPGPGTGNWGLPPTQTKYIKGLWHFGNKTGWFKWELYETGGQCRFLGRWGDLVNNQQGPVKGPWNGTQANQGPVNGGGPGGPVVIPIN